MILQNDGHPSWQRNFPVAVTKLKFFLKGVIYELWRKNAFKILHYCVEFSPWPFFFLTLASSQFLMCSELLGSYGSAACNGCEHFWAARWSDCILFAISCRHRLLRHLERPSHSVLRRKGGNCCAGKNSVEISSEIGKEAVQTLQSCAD